MFFKILVPLPYGRVSSEFPEDPTQWPVGQQGPKRYPYFLWHSSLTRWDSMEAMLKGYVNVDPFFVFLTDGCIYRRNILFGFFSLDSPPYNLLMLQYC
jgi:hypothetical protein